MLWEVPSSFPSFKTPVLSCLWCRAEVGFLSIGKMGAGSHLCGFSDQVTPSSHSLGIGSKGQPKATELQRSITS